MYRHALKMLCCNSYVSSVHFIQKQHALQRLCAERLNSCWFDTPLSFLSLFFPILLLLGLCLGSRISTSNKYRAKGIVFHLETAGKRSRITATRELWASEEKPFQCKYAQMPLFEIQSDLRDLITPPNCPKINSSPCIPHLPYRAPNRQWLIMEPPNVIIIKKPLSWRLWRRGDHFADSFVGLGLSRW